MFKRILGLGLVVLAVVLGGCEVLTIPVKTGEALGGGIVDGANYGGKEVQYLTGLEERPGEIDYHAPVPQLAPEKVFDGLQVQDQDTFNKLVFLMNTRVDPAEWPEWRLRLAIHGLADVNKDKLASTGELRALSDRLTSGWTEAEAARLEAAASMTNPDGTPRASGGEKSSGPRTRTGWATPGGK